MKAKTILFKVALLGIFVLVAVPQCVLGEQLSFKNVPLDEVIKILAQQTGRNFMLSPRLAASLNAEGKPVQQPAIYFEGETTFVFDR